jgi:dGTPase
MPALEITARPRHLAAFAQTDQSTRGREHIEEPLSFYDEWSFDCAKILSSRSWALSAAKNVWDHPAAKNHTWLKITIQAAFIARQVAQALHCNVELTEACALVMNLGRNPGSYEGWRASSWMMTPVGGFDAYLQSKRMIEEIETIHPNYNGLNLTWETREVLAYASGKKVSLPDTVLGFAPTQPSLEASIAIQAHNIAQILAALSLALQHSLILPENLRQITLWQSSENHILQLYKRLEERRRNPLAIAHLRDTLIHDLIKTSRSLIEADEPISADAVRKSEKKYILHSPQIADQLPPLEDLLNTTLNHDPQRLPGRQRRIARICSLLELLQNNTTLLGPYASQRLKKDPPQRVVCDYLTLLSDEDLNRMINELLVENKTQSPTQCALQLE